jgi:hypothetical protein
MKAIFTNDDAGVAPDPRAVEAFQIVVDWLQAQGIRGTFFWVPKPAAYEEAHELWDPIVVEARDRGHDFQLHGLTHATCLEFGVPQESTRRANPAPFEEYHARPAFWKQAHSKPSLLARLRQAIDIYVRVFGDNPRVFRAPCFGVCPAMYHALAEAGILHSSSRGVNPTATAYTILGDLSLRRWAPDFPCKPWLEPPGVVEYPCMEDLCIGGVTREQFDDRLDLVLSELQHFIREAGEESVLVFGSHYHSMVRTWEQTRPLLENVLGWLADNGVEKWVTFREFLEARL